MRAPTRDVSVNLRLLADWREAHGITPEETVCFSVDGFGDLRAQLRLPAAIRIGPAVKLRPYRNGDNLHIHFYEGIVHVVTVLDPDEQQRYAEWLKSAEEPVTA